jgi:hypothetical protein
VNVADTHGANRADESLGELIRDATDQLSTLVRDELALARAELTAKAGHAAKGAGLFGGAGLVALYGVAGLLAGLVLLLAHAMPGWAAALLVGAVLLLVAGLLALLGRGEVRQAVPPAPTEAIAGIRTDIDTVTTAVEQRGQRA